MEPAAAVVLKLPVRGRLELAPADARAAYLQLLQVFDPTEAELTTIIPVPDQDKRPLRATGPKLYDPGA